MNKDLKPKDRALGLNHISVDCVVLGFDGVKLKVLLVERTIEDQGQVTHDMKLPGSLIYRDEDLDAAAARVLNDLTGLKNVDLFQFRAFGSKDRTNNQKDVYWLERAIHSKVDRIITIGYLSLVKINRQIKKNIDKYHASWVSVEDVEHLAFDHNAILKEAILYVRNILRFDPSYLFNLLPRKFTMAQLRNLYVFIFDDKIEVRNFYKKVTMLKYVVPLEEFEENVPHRAARYYRFDKKIFKEVRRY